MFASQFIDFITYTVQLSPPYTLDARYLSPITTIHADAKILRSDEMYIDVRVARVRACMLIS